MSDKENDDHDFQPPKKRARSKSMRGEAARFKAPISEKEMAVLDFRKASHPRTHKGTLLGQ